MVTARCEEESGPCALANQAARFGTPRDWEFDYTLGMLFHIYISACIYCLNLLAAGPGSLLVAIVGAAGVKTVSRICR